MKNLWKLMAAVVAIALLGAACTATVTEPDPTTESTESTDPADASEAETRDSSQSDELPATESTEGEERSESDTSNFSVADQLELIPVSVLDDSDGFATISMADVGAAADIARVRPPVDPRSPDQAVEFLGPLTGRDPAGFPLRTFVLFPPSFIQQAGRTDEIVDELGFSAGQMQTFVAATAPPAEFIVVSGVDAPTGLPEVAPGVTALGDGEDFAVDFEDRSAYRNLGRPLRFGARDGLVAMSRATPPVEGWLDGNYRSLADDPHLEAMAETLDEFNIVSALFVTTEVGEPIGMGWGEDEQAPFVVLVWSFDTSAAAAEESVRIADALDGLSLRAGVPIADLLTVESVEQRDAGVVALARFPEGSSPAVPWELLISADGPYAE